MATKSISADVRGANSKLATFLRRQDEEEKILQIGKRKPKQAREERLPGGSGRWQLEPDWKAPTPMVDRPRTVAGSTSFHFSYMPVTKTAVPTVNGTPVEGSFGQARHPALDHSKYIERDGAAEVSQGLNHAAYIERPEAIEGIDPAGLFAEQHERSIAHVVNETPTAEEAELLGIEATAPEGIPSVFSNISDDAFERQEFWRAVERIEPAPRTHHLILEPDVSPDWWASLQADGLLPRDFREHALAVAEDYRQYLAIEAHDRARKPFKAKPFTASLERAGEIISAAQRMPSYRDWAPPFRFESGRGGRIQFRMVAELPHEVTAEDRALIVQNFCDHLASIQERRHLDGTPYKDGMMYTAVIHAPDAHNDSRNYHLHVVAYDRPCAYLPEHGMWDFEVEQRYNHKGEDRVRFPYRQAKLQDMARTEEGRDPATTGKNFVPTLRAKFAEINNAVLKARGIRRRLDPRKYSEMGIDRTPTEHLGTKAAALEAIGVPTAVGQLNAIAIWFDAERAIKRQAVQAAKTYGTGQADLNGILQGAGRVAPTHAKLPDFRALVVERERLIKDVADDREAIMTFDHLEAKAKSRAIRTRQTCLQFLADIKTGRADRSTKAMRLVIEDRWKGAQQHIESIDKALAPHREALAKAARSIEARERRIAEIDSLVSPTAETFRRIIAAATPNGQQPAKKAPKASPAATQAEKPQPVTATSQSAPTADQEAAAVVPTEIEPATIEGLPIVEPTLAPREPDQVDQDASPTAAPDGLEPLRPAVPAEPVLQPEQEIAADLDEPGASQPQEAQQSAPDVAEPTSEAAGPKAPDPAPTPKVDGRKKSTEPALFNLPKQEAPAKPGTTRAEYIEFDKLVNRIINDRIPVVPEKGPGNTTVFTVPSLSEAERDILASPRFAHRTDQRLGAIHVRQGNEIQRVVRWIGSAGNDPSLLILANRSAKLGGAVKTSIRTLFNNWGGHPSVIAALRAESQRRVELAKAEAAKPKPQPTDLEKERAARREEADRLYPEANQAFTEEVAEFITLLRDAASDEKLRAAADAIYANPRAREDINRHNVHLATAYREHVEGVDPRLAQQQRDRNSRSR